MPPQDVLPSSLQFSNSFLSSSKRLIDAAGYNSGNCCPSPSADVVCTLDNSPVFCGNHPNYCEYSNECLAEAAGYQASECCKGPSSTCDLNSSGDSTAEGDVGPQMCGPNYCLYGR